MDACDISDTEVEPQPLWEYPCQAAALPKPVMTFDLTKEANDHVSETIFDNLLPSIKKRGSGMAFWMDWHLTDTIITSTGPAANVQVGQYVQWNMHHKQGVHFFVEKNENVDLERIQVVTTFKANDGDISFQFNLD